MLDSTNRQLVDKIFIRLGEKLDKSLYLLDTLTEERSNLSLMPDDLYYYIAGTVLLLEPDGSDESNNPTLVREQNKELYEGERKIITRYLLTLTNFELKGEEHDEALSNFEGLLHTTTRTFNKEFLNVLHLIYLFDSDQLYKKLCPPLANFAINILYNEYKKQE